jgi:DNA-binding NarL/FixJ family response regulator
MSIIKQTDVPHKIRRTPGAAAEPPHQARREACESPSLSSRAPAVQSSKLGSREQEVLRCLAQGQSRRKIASSLFISPATVHTHLKNIYVKLDAHNSIEAINEARRRLLLD